MSKQKKKKPNLRNLDKIAKAQHKNEYFRKIRKVLDAIGCSHVLAMMPPGELDIIYSNRCQSINVSIAAGDVMPPGKLKWIKRLLSAMLKRYEVKLMDDSGTVDLDTFFTAGITLTIYASILEDDMYHKSAEVKEALILFAMDHKFKNIAFGHLRQILVNISLMMSDMTKRMYWATVDLKVAKHDYNNAYHVIWHSIAAEKTNVKINNENHIGYKLGLPQYQTGPYWISYPPGDYGFPGANPAKDITVYIQAHALHRLFERNDCVTRESILIELIKSLEEPNFRVDQSTGKIFIDFNLYNVKTGYLLANMVHNKLIIRTFLFITHTGSPEGNIVHRNIGLKKDELQFLELDRLSTFMTCEIQENKRIKQFFVEAGLKSLFDLYKILKEKNITITKHANATLIEDYLGIDLTKEFLDEETDEEDETDEDESRNEEEEYDNMPAQETLAAAAADKRTYPDAAENVLPKFGFGKRIFLGLLTFFLRTVAMVLPFKDRTDEKYFTEAEKAEAEKADKFSPRKLGPAGKIIGWLLIIAVALPSYILFLLWRIIRRIFMKDKKKGPVKIDYKQFQLGRKRKNKRK